jgi:hypothetical protein
MMSMLCSMEIRLIKNIVPIITLFQYNPAAEKYMEP